MTSKWPIGADGGQNDTTIARNAWLRGMLSGPTYFCNAYTSWQKGGDENANGPIRRWLPRNTNLDDLGDDDFQETAMTLNLTRRKCLAYPSPLEAFLAELGNEIDIRFSRPVALRG